MEQIKQNELTAKIKRLHIPADQYVVIGSGIMTALGIRQSADVDLLVTPEVFAELQKRGWKTEVVEIEGRPREKVSTGDVEAFKDFWYGGVTRNVNDLIQTAQHIEGVPFMLLKDLIHFKRSIGREKDLKDIQLIEEYMQKHPEAR